MDHGLIADNPLFVVNGDMDNPVFFDKALELVWRQTTGITRNLFYKKEDIGLVFYWHKVDGSIELSYSDACRIAWEWLTSYSYEWSPIPSEKRFFNNFIGEVINGWTSPPDPHGDAWDEEAWLIVRGEWGHVNSCYSSFLIRPAHLWIGK